MQKTREYAPPVPRDQFAAMIDRSLAWVRVLIHEGRLPALELVQDKKTLESILVPYTSGKAKQQSLFIDPALAAACQKVMGAREGRPKGIKGPRGKFLTDEELDATVKQKTNDNSNILVPVPLIHLSKRVGLNIPTLCAAIKEGNLQAVEFVLDHNSSKLVVHKPRPMRGNALYVLPDEARRFIAEEQIKRKAIKQQHSEATEDISKELEQKVLEAARYLKQQDPQGIVERGKVLEIVSGKRNNMHLAKKIRYILDQHLEEFPPHRSGPHAFLTREAAKGK